MFVVTIKIVNRLIILEEKMELKELEEKLAKAKKDLEAHYERLRQPFPDKYDSKEVVKEGIEELEREIWMYEKKLGLIS